MKKLLTGFTSILLLGGGLGAAWAHDDSDHDRGAVSRFVTLPDGVRFPEGITANPANGDIYVSTFDTLGNPNKLLRYSRHGQLLAQRTFDAPLLGLEFDRAHNKVYVTNVGDFVNTGSKIQRIAANFNSATPIEEVAAIPAVGAPPVDRVVGNPDGSSDTIHFGGGARVPNAMAFDSHGNLYISDSFQGAIFRIDNVASCATPCVVTLISHDPLLATAGFPPFGANGLAVSGDGKALFVANTGDDRVLKLDLTKPALSTDAVSVFAESINGADGIVFDRLGRLWVCANQSDEVVALNANGRVVARLGAFEGIGRHGAPRGLLFPASPVIVGDDMFVTNLAIPLTGAVGDEPEEDVTRWTVSRIELPGL
jgi:DNA-binding beta-propeller fold protein YncE